MDKTVEELKHNAYKKIQNAVGTEWIEYHFDEGELSELLGKVSREAKKNAYSEGHSIGYQRGKNEANIRNKRGY